MDSSFIFFSCGIPLIVLNLMVHKTAKEFAKLYNNKIDPNQIFSPEQMNKKYRNNSIKVILDGPKEIFKMYKIMWFTKYSDPELNKRVKVIRLYFLAMCLVLVINFLIILKTIY